jgi:hypothetical protein
MFLENDGNFMTSDGKILEIHCLSILAIRMDEFGGN